MQKKFLFIAIILLVLLGTVLYAISFLNWPRVCNIQPGPKCGSIKWCTCLGLVANHRYNPVTNCQEDSCIGIILDEGGGMVGPPLPEPKPIPSQTPTLSPSPTPTPLLTPTLSPTPINGQEEIMADLANWKTYRNKEYGFEIKYPAEVRFSSEGPNVAQQATNEGEPISGTIQPSYDTIIFSDNNNEIAKIEIFHKYEKDIRSEDYKEEGYLYLYGLCDLRWGFEPTSINMSLINETKVLVVKGKMNNNSDSCYYLKNSLGNLIVFSNSGYKADVFEQMLNSFKFVE